MAMAQCAVDGRMSMGSAWEGVYILFLRMKNREAHVKAINHRHAFAVSPIFASA
jgi:hypothetical protein